MLPLTPPQCLSRSRWANFLASYIHSHADGSAYVCQICSQSVKLFVVLPTFLNLWSLIPSKFPLGLDVLIYLAYVHALVNMYTCAKCGPDRSSGLEAFPDSWIDDPLTPMPLGYQRVHLSSCPFPHECAYVWQSCFRSVQLFGLFPTFLKLRPLTPLGLEGVLVIAYVHSLMNLHTWVKFCPDRSCGLEAFPDLWIDDPLTPMPLGYRCIFHTFLNLWQPDPLTIPLGARGLNCSASKTNWTIRGKLPFTSEATLMLNGPTLTMENAIKYIGAILAQRIKAANGPFLTLQVACMHAWRRTQSRRNTT